MNVFGVFGFRHFGVERELLAVYSTRQRARALVEAQDRELQLWMRIEEIAVDKDLADEFWKQPTARVIAVAELVAKVEQMVRESGPKEGFDARQWLLDWLTRPHPVLVGRRPEEFLDTEEDRQVLRDILGRMQSGAYT